MNRGMMTEELAEKYGITLGELRLIPYFQYLLVNQMAVDPNKVNSDERKIMQKWQLEGKITFSCNEPVTATREFWDWTNNILWDSYVLHHEGGVSDA